MSEFVYKVRNTRGLWRANVLAAVRAFHHTFQACRWLPGFERFEDGVRVWASDGVCWRYRGRWFRSWELDELADLMERDAGRASR